MYIKSLHIEEFGPLENVHVENLPQTMAVFLGENEAGKSSSMEFIRTMLTGIPNKRDLFYQSMKTFKGGSLCIEDEKYGEMLLERKFSARSNRNLKVFNQNGDKIDNSIYFNLLDNISQEVYRLIFGFNLNELQNFSAFQETNIFENILGASYGLGLNSPELVLQKLQTKMEELYKNKGKTSTIQNLFTQWKEEAELAEEAKNRIVKFDELQQKLENARRSALELADEKERNKKHRKELEVLLTIYNQWKKWADLQKEFVRMRALSGDAFNAYEGGAEVLFTKIMEQRRLKEEYVASLLYNQRQLEAKLRQLPIDTTLISQHNAIKDLTPLSQVFARLLAEIPSKEVQIEQANYALETQNAKCIEKWLQFDVKNSFAHNYTYANTLEHFVEVIETSTFFETWAKYESLVREAKAQVQNAKTALEYAKRDVEKAEQKYALVCAEKADLSENTSVVPKNLVMSQDALKQEEVCQQWQVFIQQTEQKEKDLLDLSTVKCTEFLNRVKNLGFTVYELSEEGINTTTIQAYIGEYMRLAELLREVNAKKDWLAQKTKEFLDKHTEMLVFSDKVLEETAKIGAGQSDSQKRLDEIHGLERKNSSIIEKVETFFTAQTENNKENEEVQAEPLPSWTKIPSILCFSFGFLLLIIRFLSGDVIANTFLGQLNIPFFVPFVLLFLGGVQTLLLKKYATTPVLEEVNTLSHSLEEKNIEELLQELQDNQDKEEKLLQCFFPHEQLLLEEGISEDSNADSEKQNENLLQFGEELEQKILESSLPIHSQVIEKAKEKQKVFKHYIKLIAKPEVIEIDLNSGEKLDKMEKEVDNLEQELLNFFKHYSCKAPQFDSIQAFIDELGKLDTFIQEINSISIAIAKCHDRYTHFVEWTKENAPELFEKIKSASSDVYVAELIAYKNALLEEEYQRIQAEYGVLFAESLSSFEESKEHYEQVVKTVQDRQDNVFALFSDCSEFLVKMNILQRDSQEKFIEILCKEEEQEAVLGTFAKIKAFIDSLFYLKNICDEQTERKAQLESLRIQQNTFIEPLRAILIRVDFTPSKTIQKEDDYLAMFRELETLLETEMKKFNEKEVLLKEYENAKEIHTKALQDLEEVEQTLQQLFQATGVQNEEELNNIFAQIKESERYVQQAIAIEESLEEVEIPQFVKTSAKSIGREYVPMAGQKALPQIFNYFDENAKARFEEEYNALLEEEKGFAEISKHIQELEAKVEAESALLYEESLTNDAHYRMKKIEDKIKSAYNDWLSLAFTKEVLEQAKKQYEETSQPEIVKIAGEFFADITNNAWQNIRVSLEDKSVFVVNDKQEQLNAEMLSQGAKEQLYLSLRLAHIRHRSQTKRTLPILMDDILVNFDEKRIRNTAVLLNKMVENQLDTCNNQQIFFYTCHENTAKILEEMVQGTKVFTVHDKKIYR